MKNKADSGAAGITAGRQARTPYNSPQWRSIWLRSVDAACSEWKRLPYNDVAQTGGDPQQLVALLQQHYKLAEGEARRQVEHFLAQCQTTL